MIKKIFGLIACIVYCTVINAAQPKAADADGYPLTDATLFGDIGGTNTNVGGIIQTIEQYGPFATTNDVVLNPVLGGELGSWKIFREGVDVTSQVQQPTWDRAQDTWVVENSIVLSEDFAGDLYASGDFKATRIEWTEINYYTFDSVHYSATRDFTEVVAYTLGSQTNKILALASSVDSKASTNDVILTVSPEWSEWSVSPDPLEFPGAASWYISYSPSFSYETPWVLTIEDSQGMMLTEKYGAGDENATVLHLTDGYSEPYTATRTRLPQGYILGSQNDKVLAPANEVLLTPIYGGNGEEFSDQWEYEGVPAGATNIALRYDSMAELWMFTFKIGTLSYLGNDFSYPPSSATNLILNCECVSDPDGDHPTYTVFAALVRTFNPIISYTLGSQTNKVLASVDSLATIAPGYATVSNKAVNAVTESLTAATNSLPMIDLISPYGIISGASNAVEQMSFTGFLATNRFSMAYDSSAANPDTWSWTLYSGETTTVIDSGTETDFSPAIDTSVTIPLASSGAAIYGTDSIEFRLVKSYTTESGIVRESDLTTIVYDDETDWMSLYFNGQTARYYPNSNQVETIASNVTQQSLGSYDASYEMSEERLNANITLNPTNQTVTFLNFTNTTPTVLTVRPPSQGRCKDWIVYVQAVTNVSVHLESPSPYTTNWWVTDAAVTNDIPGGTPTALYFSQVSATTNEMTVTMGRMEFQTL